ncbi:MAG: PepSY-like domain-containing protein [Cyclobacteriaceae bacterium]
MINKFLVFAITASVFFSCQDSEEFDSIASDVDGLEVVTEAVLPEAVKEFVSTNFVGELVVSSNALVGTEGVEAYDALLSTQLNLVFDANGALLDFAEDDSSLNCDRRPGRGGKGGKGRPMGDSTRAERPMPTEITVEELPEVSQDYITTNYPDSTVLKVLSKVNREELTVYKVLIANVGALIFDEEGAFVELYQRGGGSCASFEEVAVEDLSEAITTYISDNYPDIEVLRARTATVNEEVQTYVSLAGTGVLIFDDAGVFVELRECGMKRG